ncbi:hypothetical protein [Botrimarina sp.]|uniref:hypothetical protein n=1 Tax=Botrimarina sp. TaxID=2795802 RepID=UPI0032EE5CC1
MRVRLALIVLAAAATLGAPALAQGPFDPGPANAPQPKPAPSEYTRTVGSLTPTEIIQQKAQANAAQRQARIASREWYGYSQARPIASPIPYTGRYGAHYEGHVLGRPTALYAARPVVVIGR